MLRNLFILTPADGWSCHARAEAGGQDRSQLLLLQEPALLQAGLGEGAASPPSHDPGTHSATQRFVSPASSAKSFELASGLLDVTVPDTADAGVHQLNPVTGSGRGHKRATRTSLSYILIFQRFQLQPFLFAFQKYLNLLNPAFGMVRRYNWATSHLRWELFTAGRIFSDGFEIQTAIKWSGSRESTQGFTAG